MTVKQVDQIIKQIMYHKEYAMRNDIDNPSLDKQLLSAYRLREKLEFAEKRNAVIDSILD